MFRLIILVAIALLMNKNFAAALSPVEVFSSKEIYFTPCKNTFDSKVSEKKKLSTFLHHSTTRVFTSPQKEILKDKGLSDELIFNIEFLHKLLSKPTSRKKLTSFNRFKIPKISKLSKLQVKILESQVTVAKRRLIKQRLSASQVGSNIVSPLLRLAVAFEGNASVNIPRTRSHYKTIKEQLESISKNIKTLNDIEKISDKYTYVGDDFVSDRLSRIQDEVLTQADADLSATDLEETYWKDFLTYFEQRTHELETQSKSLTKISPAEIERVFRDTVQHHYTRLTVDDCEVYVSKTTLDLDRINMFNHWKTNMDLMNEGRNPIGPDGKPMHLHHLTRVHPGALVLITETLHQRYNKLLHFKNDACMPQPKALDRRIYSSWKNLALKQLTAELADNIAVSEVKRALFAAEDPDAGDI